MRRMEKKQIPGVILGWIGNGSGNGSRNGSCGMSVESCYHRERGTVSGV
jgi:hypothetical protein